MNQPMRAAPSAWCPKCAGKPGNKPIPLFQDMGDGTGVYLCPNELHGNFRFPDPDTDKNKS